MSDDDETIIVLLLLKKLSQKKRRRSWIHPINAKRHLRGILCRLYPQLCDDDGKFFNYMRMSRSSFEELLNSVGPKIYRQDTNFRKAITARERLLVTLRLVCFKSFYSNNCTHLLVALHLLWGCTVKEHETKKLFNTHCC